MPPAFSRPPSGKTGGLAKVLATRFESADAPAPSGEYAESSDWLLFISLVLVPKKCPFVRPGRVAGRLALKGGIWNRAALAPLTIARVMTWKTAHREQTGDGSLRSGFCRRRETWSALN